MYTTTLKIEKLAHNKYLPEYKTEGAAGMDLCAAIEKPVTLQSLERTLIPTGIKIELEKGFEAQSKLGANKKSIIFTESKRTQEFLFDYLEEHGFKDKVVLFNGTNTDSKSKEIYNNWIEKYQWVLVGARRGALARNSAKADDHIFARTAVPCPAVSGLPGITMAWPFFTRLSAASSRPSSGGLRSSSAELMASSAASMRSIPGSGL